MDRPSKEEMSPSGEIWSIGVILYKMCTLKHPFGQNKLKIKAGKYEPIPQHYSKSLSELVEMMLQVNPDKRASIDTVLSKLSEMLDNSYFQYMDVDA